MFINIQLCQSADINLKFAGLIDNLGQVSDSNSEFLLSQEYPVSQLFRSSVIVPASVLKVKDWKIHFLSG